MPTVYCVQCRTPVEPQDWFCMICGLKMNESTIVTQPTTPSLFDETGEPPVTPPGLCRPTSRLRARRRRLPRMVGAVTLPTVIVANAFSAYSTAYP